MRLLTFGAAVILGVGVACSGLAATADATRAQT
jgi:hypothetical protein